MTTEYRFCEAIDLHVEGRITGEDAKRQEKTVRAILTRLSRQPGLILADEVGMGKTFVALAAAASVALTDPFQRPVVVMVPPSLKEKWPKDFALFREQCLPPEMASQLSYGQAERPVEFLKLLDDPSERRKQILFVTHGAMSRALFDKWVKLALIQHAIAGRHGVGDLRKHLARFMPDILQMKAIAHWDTAVWVELLEAQPRRWLTVMQRHSIDPDGQDRPEEADDPVPEAVLQALDRLDTADLYEALLQVPKRRSANLAARIRTVRKRVHECLQRVWRDGIQALDLQLPLVILDEAHHLKNRHTKLASLFHLDEAREDANTITRGALGGVFERMLFLTATPFQLGHDELCSVLERFSGIAWHSPFAPVLTREQYHEEIAQLRRSLDAAQLAALRLERAWGQITQADFVVDGVSQPDVDDWWSLALKGGALSENGTDVLNAYRETRSRMGAANRLLKPWVIRHLKPRQMGADERGRSVSRRERVTGRGIAEEETVAETGLEVAGTALLPFLLAARAVTSAPDARPVFAEGLASSYEAFLHTRQATRDAIGYVTDIDDDDGEALPSSIGDSWYLDSLEQLLLVGGKLEPASHPKIAATVRRVVDLWSRGEKVLVFCHYVATGRVLRQRISAALEDRMMELAAEKLGCGRDQVVEHLERIASRFDDKEAPIRFACEGATQKLLQDYPEILDRSETLVRIVRRFMRTPSLLVRYFPLAAEKLDETAMTQALATRDASRMSLEEVLRDFFEFLAKRCSSDERDRYLEALGQLQTGMHYGADVDATYSDDELQGEKTEALSPNVRLVNGATRQETRQRLMLTFNTPFYPEVLIASSVMAEGVDLHLSCRFVIHHDLCWNPSTLEQRTGRIDRIGAKCERSRQPVVIYLPYLSETQDEKMYRVVMDRERWFSVVMGEKYTTDARTTDRIAERVPLPEAAAKELAFRLDVS